MHQRRRRGNCSRDGGTAAQTPTSRKTRLVMCLAVREITIMSSLENLEQMFNLLDYLGKIINTLF